MSAEEMYLLDANVFIQAKQRYYPFDVAPGFWTSLSWYGQSGKICSVDKVRDEIEKGADDLWTWCQGTFPGHAFHDSVNVAQDFSAIAGWVQANAQFTQAAKSEFMSVADGWLAAYAKATGRILVTLEEPKPDAKRRVPLPNVCNVFGVDCITTFEMLRRLGVILTWTAPQPGPP